MPEKNTPNLPSSSTGKYLKDDGTWGTPGGGPGAINWGDIGGTLADQTDLQTALDGKANALGADDNYVTDAEKTKLSNLSGTNTGDQDLSGKQDVLVSATNIKTINGSSILGSGDLVVSGSGLAQFEVRRILRR